MTDRSALHYRTHQDRRRHACAYYDTDDAPTGRQFDNDADPSKNV